MSASERIRLYAKGEEVSASERIRLYAKGEEVITSNARTEG